MRTRVIQSDLSVSSLVKICYEVFYMDRRVIVLLNRVAAVGLFGTACKNDLNIGFLDDVKRQKAIWAWAIPAIGPLSTLLHPGTHKLCLKRENL